MNTKNPLNRLRHGFSTATLLAFSAVIAQAHPGHSLSDASPTHLLSSPDHILVLALSGGLLILGARFMQRAWPRRILQSAGALALAGAVLVWGSHLI